VAGHSLGEYSALVAAGALDFPAALRLVRRRGELMQEAVPPGVGAMAAILGLERQAVAKVARTAQDELRGEPESGLEGGAVCSVANDNAPGQTVIAGHTAAVERAVELARERGARKAVRLGVSAPFHCPLMRPAREAMAELLEATPFADPRMPVVTNVDAAPVTSGAQLRQALIRQIDSPVRWTESVERLAGDGVTSFLEVGPGKVLTGLVRRIAREAATAHLDDLDKLPDVLAALGEVEGGTG
jgi:[acyl-carrier-protein] S-malonyltransferase